VDFKLEPGDIAIRLNFASIDKDGKITDRRAGRPSDDENKRLVGKLRAGVQAPAGVKIFFESEKEHRAVLVLRGAGLTAGLADTDPQIEGVPPLAARATEPGSEQTAAVLQQVLDAAFKVLADEPTANALLARGIDAYQAFPTFEERYQLRARAIAKYPMYRGVARLVGMQTSGASADDADSVRRLGENFADYDFHFVHAKYPDSRGEDGNFEAKVAAIEAVDQLIPQIEALKPEVLIVTGDHSTPARLRAHSWHPVPIMIVSPWTRPNPDATFGERSCQKGELGIFPGMHIMTLALAHARRLAKYGA
jgi:2,3-bisphosphoglycerate-independent phosphoglycerate mutase